MLEIIIASFLFFSLVSIGLILFKKIPILLGLADEDSSKLLIVSGVKKIIRNIPGAKKFDYELYLQKMLSKIQVLTLKTESKTGGWLEKLRKRRNGNNNHDDGYWQELKKAKDGK